MKRLIYNTEDWGTNTDDPEINAFRSIMLENKEYEGDPYVGIFWYDTYNDELFGVRSALAEDTEFKMTDLFPAKARTCRPLHENVWKKERYKQKPDPRFNRDYTKVPRGRIFEVEGQGFVVCVGSWINEYPQAKQLIIDEFDLPKDQTRFKIDTHWELGHGWS